MFSSYLLFPFGNWFAFAVYNDRDVITGIVAHLSLAFTTRAIVCCNQKDSDETQTKTN